MNHVRVLDAKVNVKRNQKDCWHFYPDQVNTFTIRVVATNCLAMMTTDLIWMN